MGYKPYKLDTWIKLKCTWLDLLKKCEMLKSFNKKHFQHFTSNIAIFHNIGFTRNLMPTLVYSMETQHHWWIHREFCEICSITKAFVRRTRHPRLSKLTLIEINQNVTTPFTTTCDCSRLQLDLEYLFGLILHLFSSMNRLIRPISRNSHQISCILKVFYNDIGVYFNVCIKTKHMYMYVYCSYNESQN
jgi:hypothetical protein